MLIEPYRIFFLIGSISSLIGVSVWIFFFTGLTSSYPILTHSNIMFFAFLLSFVAGFLLTAVPRMSMTKQATKHEMICYSVLAFSQLILSFARVPQWSYLIATFQFLFLIRFIIIRFHRRKQSPPSGFIYVPMGLLIGLIGSIFLFLYYYMPEKLFLMTFGKLFLYQGFILNLIAGLGGRLIPTLSRAAGALSPLVAGSRSKAKNIWPMVALNLSFIIEGAGQIRVGNLIRFIILLYIVISQFKIFVPKNPKSPMGFFLTISALFMTVPYLFIFIFPTYHIHLLHLVYIGGLSLTTYLISTRVILAHGGYSLNYEIKSYSLWIISILLILAAMFRAMAGLLGGGEFYLHGILVGAAFWIMGIMVWFYCIGYRLLKFLRGSNGNHHK